MGCASSKRVEATIAASGYRPAPASFAVFDINAIEEPWLMGINQEEPQKEKPTHVPAPILEKLHTFELVADAPHSWSEVSKALEDLKPTLQTPKPTPKPDPVHQDNPTPQKPPRRKSFSFHTLEELEMRITSKPSDLKKSESLRTDLKKSESMNELKKTESKLAVTPPPPNDSHVVKVKPLRENLFILRDRLEREREGKSSSLDRRIGMKSRRDLLNEFPQKCPPSGVDSVVLYTTTLRGVRRTFEDCNRVRSILEGHRVAIDERDVSLHGEFLSELRELLGEGVSVPRLFVKGRYVGDVDSVVELNESGLLGQLMNSAGIRREVGWQACEGCGGARFVPCLVCGGSCKVLNGDKKERCAKCNENGLIQCPVCH
ncbi:hypothetical protein HHK36_029175 [Tetracentron sinense]|uniref:Glutaredoxin domain-containing protein n=1 Tax=Tetracentron sinense TaxID=13715 RepID=A0A834YDP5_TETSI|nr:hypothetical protein HHK36_029175 [Tetracentron sinense]